MIISDYLKRSVSLRWMIVFGFSQSFLGNIENLTINSLVVVFMLSGSWCYLKLRYDNFDFRNYMGEGDIIFIFCLTPLLTPTLFLRFLIVGLTISLVYPDRKIPLITTIGIIYIIVLIYEEILLNNCIITALLFS